MKTFLLFLKENYSVKMTMNETVKAPPIFNVHEKTELNYLSISVFHFRQFSHPLFNNVSNFQLTKYLNPYTLH